MLVKSLFVKSCLTYQMLRISENPEKFYQDVFEIKVFSFIDNKTRFLLDGLVVTNCYFY